MLTQTEIKTKSIKALRPEYFIKCKICGRFVNIDREFNGYYLSCDNCNHEVFIKYLGYKNINKTANFQAVFKNGKRDTIEIFKNEVIPVHSMDNYISH
jgi:DNA-directed RNA polymerase subunit RPC12/RpoP